MKLQGHQGAYGITREDVLAMRVGGKSRRDGRRVEGEAGAHEGAPFCVVLLAHQVRIKPARTGGWRDQPVGLVVAR